MTSDPDELKWVANVGPTTAFIVDPYAVPLASGGPRTILTADTTYYVRTDGSDANTGTFDNPTGAWLTWQYGLNWIASNIDFNSYNVTLAHGNEGAGSVFTFTAPAGKAVMELGTLGFVGGGQLFIMGNSTDMTTPTNCVLQGSGSGVFGVSWGSNGLAEIYFAGFALRTQMNVVPGNYESCIKVYGGCVFNYGWINFGAAYHHVDAICAGAQIYEMGPCTISGGGDAHWAIEGSGTSLICSGAVGPPINGPASWTDTLVGTPAFTTAFAWINDNASLINFKGITSWTGAATGPSMLVATGGSINFFGIPLPGDSDGTVTIDPVDLNAVVHATKTTDIVLDSGYLQILAPGDIAIPSGTLTRNNAEIDLGFIPGGSGGAAGANIWSYSIPHFNDPGYGGRWEIDLGNSDSETGGSTGSNFALARYMDDGTIARVMFIPRATGIVQFLAGATVVGVTDGSDSAAGMVGEFKSAAVTTGVALTTATARDLTTLALTAGDWDIVGEAYFQASTSAGTSDQRVWVNTVSATQPTGDQGGLAIVSTSSAGLINNPTTSPFRLLTSASVTLYLSVTATFNSGTMTAKGFVRARRMR
jgi:hypothetical protein